jgi:hypothetical protein
MPYSLVEHVSHVEDRLLQLDFWPIGMFPCSLVPNAYLALTEQWTQQVNRTPYIQTPVPLVIDWEAEARAWEACKNEARDELEGWW